MRTRDGKVEALRRIPGFERCPDNDLTYMCRLVEYMPFAAGQQLAAAGERAKSFFLVLDGRLAAKTWDGGVSYLDAGDHVGDADLLDGGVQTTTVTAVTGGAALTAGGAAFNALIDRVDCFRRAVLVGLAQEAHGWRETPGMKPQPSFA